MLTAQLVLEYESLPLLSCHLLDENDGTCFVELGGL